MNSIHHYNPSTRPLYRWEPELTAAEVRAERDKDRRRDEIETALDAFGDEDPAEDGDILAFERAVPMLTTPDKTLTLRYAFVRSNGKWYGTGRSTPQGVPWTALVDYLINLGVALDEIKAYAADHGDTLAEWF